MTVELTTLELSKSGMPESSKDDDVVLSLSLLNSDWQNCLKEAFSWLTSKSTFSSKLA